MRHLKKTVSTLVAGLLLQASPLLWAEDKAVTGVMVDWPPYFSDKVAEGGIAADIVRQGLQQAGYKLDHQLVPWSQAMKDSRSAKKDLLLGAWHTPERARDYLFSDPYMFNRVVFIKLLGDDYEYYGLSSLKGKEVGVLKGYAYNNEFLAAKNFNKSESSSLIVNLRNLLAQRVELTLADEYVARYTISKDIPSYSDQFAFSLNALGEEPLHLAISRKHPEAEQIISAFNRSLKAMRADGRYEEIIRKHNL